MELVLFLNYCRLNSKPQEVGKPHRLLIVVTCSAQSTTICLYDTFKKKIKKNGACRQAKKVRLLGILVLKYDI